MNEPNANPDHHWSPDREDILVGRVTDGEASPSDWTELEALAQADPALWTRLAQSQRAHARLARAVDEHAAIAELVELPLETHSVLARIGGGLTRYAGWAIAAMLAIAWSSQTLGTGANPNPTSNDATASLGSSILNAGGNDQPRVLNAANRTHDDAYRDYINLGMAEGRVLSELEPVILEATPSLDGTTLSIVVVRQTLERREVTDLREWRVLTDEHGNLVTEAPRAVKPSQLVEDQGPI